MHRLLVVNYWIECSDRELRQQEPQLTKIAQRDEGPVLARFQSSDFSHVTASIFPSLNRPSSSDQSSSQRPGLNADVLNTACSLR